MFYSVCKECGDNVENKKPGFYHRPQCKKKENFLKLEFFDGAKPSNIYEKPD